MKFIKASDILAQQNEGEEISDDALNEVDNLPLAPKKKRNTAQSTAISSGLRLISMRDHSSKQLREKLLQKGFSAAEVEEALEVFRQKRLIDDLRMGRNLIRYMAQRRYFGAYKIRMELSQRLDREFIEVLLPEELEQYDFAALAKEFAEKSPNRGKSREQMIRRLKSQGYAASEIRFALAGYGRDDVEIS